MYLKVFWIVFLVSGIIQLIILFYLHFRFAFFKSVDEPQNISLPPLSVIIAARNENDNLYHLLPLLAEQEYPEFEIIIVNNQSTDESDWLLKAFQLKYKNIKVVELSKNKHLRPGKKLPLTIGIKGANYDHLIFTDADCRPSSKMWLQRMACEFSDKKQIVLGYGPYVRKKGLLNKLIRFDTAWIAVSYFSMALAKLPYMGVGRNMAYTKKVFNSVSGFKSHYSITSGDDDLFIQEAAVNENYTIQIHPDSFCFSETEKSWNTWLFQKTRHYSTSTKYNVIKKSLLGIYPMSLVLLWLSFVILLLGKKWLVGLILIFFGIILLKWIFQGKCLHQLQEKRFIWTLPLWDIFYALLMPFLFLKLIRKQTNKW